MSPATAFDDRVVISIAKRRRCNPRALSALLKARELLALSLGLLLAKVRETAGRFLVSTQTLVPRQIRIRRS